jgi:hypothetical protein
VLLEVEYPQAETSAPNFLLHLKETGAPNLEKHAEN